jgi:hypothetical protein
MYILYSPAFVVIFPVVIVMGVAVTTYMQVQTMSNIEKHLRREDMLAERILSRIKTDTISWIDDNDYELIGAYQSQQIKFAVWRENGGVRDLIIYETPSKMVYDFVTYLQDDNTLTTSIGGETGALPVPPGDYKESVAAQTLEELDSAHRNSLEVLNFKRGLQLRDVAPDFETDLIRSVHKQMIYIKTLSFWPFRGVYGFYFGRSKMRNKTIEEQIQRGWI